MFRSVNPVNNELINEFPILSKGEIRFVLKSAEHEYANWRELSVEDRISLIKLFSNTLEAQSDELAKIITLEMGKPFKQSVAEVKKSVLLCDYYCANALKSLSPKIKSLPSKVIQYIPEPYGVLIGIMPWNFPVWQCLRFAIPALINGNCILLKPAPNTSLSVLFVENLISKTTGTNIFKTILVGNNDIKRIIADKSIRGVSFTGSAQTGGIIASMAGKNIKKTVLELGGSDPFIVFEDADLEKAVDKLIISRFNNTGQTCIAAKRILLQKSIKKPFLDMLLSKVENLKMGDPFDKNVVISTLARNDIKENLQSQLGKSIDLGANPLLSGGSVKGDGHYFKPVILTNIKKGMPVYSEEVFGPIITIIPFSDVKHAIEIANDTQYGLGASVWTNSLKIEQLMYNSLKCGYVSINDYVRSEPSVPFGGVKNSGYGKELGETGLLEFAHFKSVVKSL